MSPREIKAFRATQPSLKRVLGCIKLTLVVSQAYNPCLLL
ncbi:hypothetical Protein YC6258_05282 [Gynuella sunshinyii YC6258]|uniref:Uncharacterized protein n=1 Tax=Gynuella sunshinyii YC6258 TaxID=1445510 RepID=A0A0C5VRR1_9GAMM|nr:hypothetical Protein YC6258_05282 [Gynuella sunshinyii YC6258]